MNFLQFINQDKTINKGNTKGRFITFCFRIANYCLGRNVVKVFFYPYLLFYKAYFEWTLGIEIPFDTSIGNNLKIIHGQGLVINNKAVIGNNVVLRHCTTIGNAKSGGNCPIIEDNVNIGANCVIIGDIIIGENSTIGAGSVVVKSIPKNSIAVGNPAKVIKYL